MKKTGSRYARSVILAAVISAVTFSAAVARENRPSPGKNPPIVIRPEFYLDMEEKEVRERLPWPLEITITAVDASGKILAGPMTVVASEYVVGAEFERAVKTGNPDGKEPDEKGTKKFSTPADVSVILESLEFAAHIDYAGAYSIYIKSFVRLKIRSDKTSETYKTMTTRECWPKKEVSLAEFPGVTLKIKTRWLD